MPDATALDEIYSSVDPDVLQRSIVCLSLFLLSGVISMECLSMSGRKGHPPASNGYRTCGYDVIVLGLVGSVVGITGYLILGDSISAIKESIVDSRASVKPWLNTQNLGTSLSPFGYIIQCVMVGGASLLWASIFDNRISLLVRIPVTLVVFGVTTLLFFDNGTRAILALALFPAVSVGLIKLWMRSRVKGLIASMIALSVGILILQFQMLYRVDFTRPDVANLLFENWYTLGGTIDYFKETLFVVDIIPKEHDYFRESVLMQFITHPIPRIVWPDKPVSDVVWFFTLARWNIDIVSEAGNALPGLVGQYYMSWGLVGPVVSGTLVGVLSTLIDRYLSRLDRNFDLYRATFGVMLIIWMFMCYRLLSPVFLYHVIVSGLIVGLCTIRGRGHLVVR